VQNPPFNVFSHRYYTPEEIIIQVCRGKKSFEKKRKIFKNSVDKSSFIRYNSQAVKNDLRV